MHFGNILSQKTIGIAEDFMRLLMVLYTYRGQIGQDPQAELRSFIIHTLATADHTHQQLLRSLPQRLLKHSESIKDIHCNVQLCRCMIFCESAKIF